MTGDTCRIILAEENWTARNITRVNEKGHKQYKMKRGVWIFQTSTSKKLLNCKHGIFCEKGRMIWRMEIT